ncbi:MAG TPA: hypothetical protein VGK53_24735 [Propionicimonas sp.]
MNHADVDRILQEYAFLQRSADDPELSALRSAIFLEDVLDLTLTDEQFDIDPLADPGVLRTLVTRTSVADVRHLRPGQ